MTETQTKCFIEEVPSETLVQGTYRIESLDEKNRVWVLSEHGLHVDIYDDEQKTILSRMYSHEGKFTFTSHGVGDYRICLSTNSSSWFGGSMLRVHLDIAIGNQATDYKEVASKEKLNEIQLRVKQLIDQVNMISKDQSFQRIREDQFRALSENTNSRVTMWSFIQVSLLILIGIWQMRNLKSFFQAKKLV